MQLRRVLIFLPIVAAVVLAMIFDRTTPSTASPLILLAVFILMYVVATGVVVVLLYGGSRMVARGLELATQRKYRVPPTAALYMYGSVLATAPVLFLAMSSVGSLSVGSFALLVVFEALAIFYVSRRL